VADLKLTPTRLALLRAVADPNTDVYAEPASIRGGWSNAVVRVKEAGVPVRTVTKVAAELEQAGLIERAKPGVRYFGRRRYSLTDAGRAELAKHDKAPKE
jgi:DNA-binding MarR family transcriptional regulator